MLDLYLQRQLDALKARSLYRDPDDAFARAQVERRAVESGDPFVDASSNDYLGLARSTVSRETGAAGAGASRLVQGTRAEHVALEEDLASWVGLQAALLFTSAYAANVGTMSALGGDDAVMISDELNHASIIDGCRLARAQVLVTPHLDLGAIDSALSAARGTPVRWVVTESYFSMDGDGPNLPALRALCDRHRAFLVVDEAHGLGVFGAAGAGRCAELGVRPDVLIGGLGKAVGSQGGFVAGSSTLRAFLWNRARTFIFSSAPAPSLCREARAQVAASRTADASRERLHANVARFRSALAELGVRVGPGSFGPIVPIWIGDGQRALEAATRLRERGILAQPIRPPSVPDGTARLRLTITADLEPDVLQRLAERVAEATRN